MDRMIDAVAEAWASIDGKLEKYEQDRDTPGGMYDDGVPWGYYDGYQVEARELIARIKKRGYVLRATNVG